jgi:hypothetical protein
VPHGLAASLRLCWTILKTRDVVPHQLPALSAAGADHRFDGGATAQLVTDGFGDPADLA